MPLNASSSVRVVVAADLRRRTAARFLGIHFVTSAATASVCRTQREECSARLTDDSSRRRLQQDFPAQAGDLYRFSSPVFRYFVPVFSVFRKMPQYGRKSFKASMFYIFMPQNCTGFHRFFSVFYGVGFTWLLGFQAAGSFQVRGAHAPSRAVFRALAENTAAREKTKLTEHRLRHGWPRGRVQLHARARVLPGPKLAGNRPVFRCFDCAVRLTFYGRER
jgi:hypothetical protein